MTENYKIIGSFIKDMSSETPDAPTYIFVRDKISKYRLNIDINSKAVKDGIIEVNTIIKFSDQPEILKKAHFEITYTSIVKVDEKVSDKKEMEKIQAFLRGHLPWDQDAFDHEFAPIAQSPVRGDGRGQPRALPAFAQIAQRSQFQFEFADIGHACIGAVEGAIGVGGRGSQEHAKQGAQPCKLATQA